MCSDISVCFHLHFPMTHVAQHFFMCLSSICICSSVKCLLMAVLGGPVVRTQGFDCHGPRFNPWFGELRSHKLHDVAENLKTVIKTKNRTTAWFSSRFCGSAGGSSVQGHVFGLLVGWLASEWSRMASLVCVDVAVGWGALVLFPVPSYPPESELELFQKLFSVLSV